MRALIHALYDFESRETGGERMVFRVVETFVIALASYFASGWVRYLGLMEGMPIPSGIGVHVNLSFLLKPAWAYGLFLLLLGLLGAGYLRRGRFAYAGAVVVMHVLFSARHSLGKIGHGENLIGLGLLALALAWAFFEDDVVRRRFAWGTLCFFTGLGYVLSGGSKLIGGGLHWSNGHHLFLWISERHVDAYAVSGTLSMNWLQELTMQSHVFGTAQLTFGLVVELLGFLFWFPRTRPVITVFLLGMHAGIALAMNILFWAFMLQLLLVGLPWARLIDRILPSERRAGHAAPRST